MGRLPHLGAAATIGEQDELGRVERKPGGGLPDGDRKFGKPGGEATMQTIAVRHISTIVAKTAMAVSEDWLG